MAGRDDGGVERATRAREPQEGGEEKRTATYSHSRLKTFENCPRRFKLHYIDRLRLDDAGTIEAFLGTVVHAALEHLYDLVRSCKAPGRDEILDHYHDAWRRRWRDDIRVVRPGLLPEHYRNLGERCVAMFHDRNRPFGSGLVMGLELNVRFPLDDGHDMTGYIDLLKQTEDGICEIHDYKTGRHLPTQQQVDSDRQLGLYEIAVRHMLPDVREVRLVWHYLRHDTRLVSRRTPGQLDALREETLNLIRRIEGAAAFPANESALCDWCEYCDICPAKTHRLKVEALDADSFRNEPGVVIVNRLAELEAQKRRAVAALDAEIDEVEMALVAYAEREGVEVVVGRDREARIKRETRCTFPRKQDKGREALEALVRRAGKWNDVSDLSLSRLARALGQGSWPEEIARHVKQFRASENITSVRLRRRKYAER